MPYEHLLSCSHLAQTREPDQPCGGNCMHIAMAKEDIVSKAGLPNPFRCLACFKEGTYQNDTTPKYLHFLRESFIAAKNVAVPYDKYGRAVGVYRNPVEDWVEVEDGELLGATIPPVTSDALEEGESGPGQGGDGDGGEQKEDTPSTSIEDTARPGDFFTVKSEGYEAEGDLDIVKLFPDYATGTVTTQSILSHKYQCTVRVYEVKWRRELTRIGTCFVSTKYLSLNKDLIEAYDDAFMRSKHRDLVESKERVRGNGAVELEGEHEKVHIHFDKATGAPVAKRCGLELRKRWISQGFDAGEKVFCEREDSVDK